MERVEVDRTFPSDAEHFHERRFRWILDRTRLAPEPVVLVAGSCGKASTARFLAQVAIRLGVTVGLGTKPPLQETLEGNLERYQVGDLGGLRWLTPAEFVDLEAELAPTVEALLAERPDLGPPAPYDLRAWLLARMFTRFNVGLGIAEANIGLRRDPAGALPRPRLALLTPMGSDHAALLQAPREAGLQHLGERAGVVWHKAGGLPAGTPVVVGRQDPEILEAVERLALEAGAGPLTVYGRDYGVEGFRCGLEGSEARLRLGSTNLQVQLSVPGAFQLENAAQAAAAALALHGAGVLPGARGEVLEAIRLGLRETRIPGRMEVLGRHPAILLNVASSRQKVRALLESVAPLFANPDSKMVVCATFLDRIHRVRDPLEDLVAHPRTCAFVATRHLDDDTNRDLDPAAVAEQARRLRPGLAVEWQDDVFAALRRARELAPSRDDLVLLVGNGLAAALTGRDTVSWHRSAVRR